MDQEKAKSSSRKRHGPTH